MKILRALLASASLLAFLSTNGIAAEQKNPNVDAPSAGDEAKGDSNLPTAPAHEKKWFTGGSFGAGTTKYEGPVKTEIATHRLVTGSEKTPAFFFEGYFGWRLANHKTIIGPSLSILVDNYNLDFLPDLDVTTYFLSFMVQHHFTGDFHRALFARLDAGIAYEWKPRLLRSAVDRFVDPIREC